MSHCRDLFGVPLPIIGVCHLPPLPDYPASPGMDAVRAHAMADLHVARMAGLQGLLLENEGDRPHRISAHAATVAAMTDVSAAVARAAGAIVPGCEILLNDPCASLDVARASGAAFIRTDYFVDRMHRPEFGEFAIDPAGLLLHRSEIGAGHVLILADIQVKYATMLEPRPLRESARLAVEHRADAIVVSGSATGNAPTVEDLRQAKLGTGDAGSNVPVLIGSGLDAHNATSLLAECDGAIVGTSLMSDGHLDAAKAADLMAVVHRLRA